MPLELRDVERAASLARLALGGEEKLLMLEHLRDILAHVDALRAADTADADPAPPSPVPPAALRSDEPGPDPLLHPPAAFAPDWREGMFVVPRLAFADAPEPGTSA